MRHHRLLLLAILMLFALLSAQQPARASTLPAGFSEALVTGGLNRPTSMAFAPDGRIFITEQGGAVRVFKNGVLLPTPFLTMTVDSIGERGLLGLAFHPNFETNGYVYVYHTLTTSPRRNRITRFTASGDVAAAGSGVTIITLDDLSTATNHNGGALHFGPHDGKLYVAVGENATTSHSQTLTNRHGKMLRYNPDGTIPGDNPFFNTAADENRAIWALGLRNPFTFAFSSDGSRMMINDVGGGSFEELNPGQAGANYGWPQAEGDENATVSIGTYVRPLLDYGRSDGCAVTGGVFYTPSNVQFPAGYLGDYFYADYCNNWIRRYDLATDTWHNFASSLPSNVIDLDVNVNGSLFYLARGGGGASSGAIYRIVWGASQPSITQQPASRTVTVGERATFTCAGSGPGTLNYRWRRNGALIAGATGSSYTTPPTTPADNGVVFRCVVSNTFGSVTSSPATLTVTSNRRPTAQILTPVLDSRYSAGVEIAFSGTATDPEDGNNLPDSAFEWWINFHHADHTHPAMPVTEGIRAGTYTPANQGHTETNVWYRIYLRVTDSGGRKHTVYRDIYPRTVRIDLLSAVPGLTATLDGQPVTLPYSFRSVVGVERTVAIADTEQPLNGVLWVFNGWSNGGATSQTFATPATRTTITARWLNTTPRRNRTADATPTLTWQRVTWATGYQVQIGRREDFAPGSVVFDGWTANTTRLSFTPSTALPPRQYFWHVRARYPDGTWGPWSQAESFVITTPTAPSAE